LQEELPMTPQESQLVTELFERLAQLENSPRDPDAEDLIADLWDKAPNASYALVQSVIVQDEALKRANARIEELEAELGIHPDQPAQGGSFLDSMRERLSNRGESARSSVPSVRPGDQPMGAPAQPDARWNTGATFQQQPMSQQEPASQSGGGGGGFLGNAAAAAAGVVGGALLAKGISGLFGHSGSAQAHSFDPGLSGGGSSNPWGGSSSGGELAKDAGLGDIGRGDSVGALDTGGDLDDDSAFDVDDVFDDGDEDLGDVDAGDPE
jgi:hypothetical protein